MTKEERHSIILDLLMQHNSILVTDLAEHLNVSSVTIRKDLTDLEKEKKLYRNHGKAILINPYINDRNVNERTRLSLYADFLYPLASDSTLQARTPS